MLIAIARMAFQIKSLPQLGGLSTATYCNGFTKREGCQEGIGERYWPGGPHRFVEADMVRTPQKKRTVAKKSVTQNQMKENEHSDKID